MPDLSNKKIVLGVTGSIAVYKSVFLLRLLVKAGADVKVIMTKSASMFVSPLTFSTLSKHEVLTDLSSESGWNNHVELGLWADLILIAPATAQTIAKIANGFCDNLLTATILSAKSPVVVAPAMDLDMWHHPSTQRNISQLSKDGVQFIPVGHGELASGLYGDGRLEEPESILSFCIDYFQQKKSPLRNKKVLITLGPTVEKIDAVRYISNHSTGKMGVALIHSLLESGAEVYAVAGPLSSGVVVPEAVDTKHVQSALEMYEASLSIYKAGVDIAIFTAAVADFRVDQPSDSKIKKDKAGQLALQLIPNKDIAYELGQMKTNAIHVGFALETDNGQSNASQKLQKKNFDLIALNYPTSSTGFGADTNKVTIFDRSDNIDEVPIGSKKVIADYIIKRLESFFH